MLPAFSARWSKEACIGAKYSPCRGRGRNRIRKLHRESTQKSCTQAMLLSSKRKNYWTTKNLPTGILACMSLFPSSSSQQQCFGWTPYQLDNDCMSITPSTTLHIMKFNTTRDGRSSNASNDIAWKHPSLLNHVSQYSFCGWCSREKRKGRQLCQDTNGHVVVKAACHSWGLWKLGNGSLVTRSIAFGHEDQCRQC